MSEFVERLFSRVPVRRVPEVVPERNRLGKVLVEPQSSRNGAGYLTHLERVRKPRAVVVALGRKKNLRFVLKPAKRLAMQYPVAVALKIGAQSVFGERTLAPLGVRRLCGVFAQVFGFYLVRYIRITRYVFTYCSTLAVLKNNDTKKPR